jgi:hypothetical protein
MCVSQIKLTQSFLIAAFIMIIVSVGLTQITVELSRGQRPQIQELFLNPPTQANLNAFEKGIERSCWLAEKLRPWAQYLNFLVLTDAGDKAIVGRDGWFFYKPSVRYLVEPCSTKSEVISAIQSFRERLADRGIELMVVIAPNKASVYPEMLARRSQRLPQPANPDTLAIISELSQAGVELVNLFDVFSQERAASSDSTQYYLSQDSHWSAEGVTLAAKAVAKRLQALGWVEKAESKYELRPAVIKRHGDILEMMQTPQLKHHFAPEPVHCIKVFDADTDQAYTDNPDSPVLVLGDSFLRIYQSDEPGSAGFIAHLAAELGFDLASIVSDGGASTLVRQALYRKPALLANKKLVIWEFVERDIRFGTEGWQEIPLPILEP